MVVDRSTRQQEGIEKWLAHGARGTWQYVTGFGKTYTALTVIKRMQKRTPLATTAIVVPTLYLKEQFEVAIQKAKLPNVQVWVVNSFVKHSFEVDLIIVDEVHIMLGEHAEQFPLVFKVCKAPWWLCLSATLTDEEQQRLSVMSIPVVDTITMAEALTAGWVAPHLQYNLPVELTETERAAYDTHHRNFSTHFAKFGHDFQLAMACMSNPEARMKHAAFMGWKPTDGPRHVWSPPSLGAFANMWHRAMKERKYVVDHAEAKYTAALELIHRFEVPTICFSESTTFASELAARCPNICRAYHSQIASTTETYTTTKTFKTKPDEVLTKERRVSGSKLASLAVQQFRDSTSAVRVLSTAKALDQGADFPELRLGIETSGNGSIRQKVQRTGRVVRTDNTDTNQQAVYVHVFAADTYELAKLKRKQKGMRVTTVSSLTDIHF